MSVATLTRTLGLPPPTRSAAAASRCSARKPRSSVYTNNPDASAGLVKRGKLNVNDLVKHSWPKKKNVSADGLLHRSGKPFPGEDDRGSRTTRNECKNIVIRVDRYGGAWRWTGMCTTGPSKRRTASTI
jgi:hypothetical protein